jgi:hypothetical protein
MPTNETGARRAARILCRASAVGIKVGRSFRVETLLTESPNLHYSHCIIANVRAERGATVIPESI